MSRSTVLHRPGVKRSPIAFKPRRVRTGCLTCRERHLKCDEAQPDCLNCRKSSRTCKRGIRLNFLDIVVKAPPYLLSPEGSTDESREIASEYQGGLSRYDAFDVALELMEKRFQKVNQVNQVVALRQRHGAAAAAAAAAFASTKREHEEEASPRRSFAAAPCYQTPRGYLSPRSAVSFGNSNNDATQMYTQGSSIVAASAAVAVNPGGAVLATKSEPAYPCHYSIRTGSSSVMARLTPAAYTMEQDMLTDPVMSTHFTIPSPEETTQQGLDYLGTLDETRFMQEFARGVAVWMDAFDKENHFSHILPHQALKSPMLLNAALACGAEHLATSSAEYHDKALSYYDTASSQLLRSLQNPDRNTSECAVTVQVLYVYEIMCREPFHRMNHVRGARALIKECNWSASTTGIGHACFWLNVSMEMLNCLAMNWPLTWDPDEWSLPMMKPNEEAQKESGHEEEWLHTIFVVVAKVVNFRSQNQSFHRLGPREKNVAERQADWKQLKRQCDEWVAHCPRTMHPVGYIAAEHTELPSVFPKVWLSCSAALLGRVFYHLALCLLGQSYPRESSTATEGNRSMQIHHAHAICGIIAHTDDQSAAAIAPRCLAIVASNLTIGTEQKEVLRILQRLEDKNWLVGNMAAELESAWGWKDSQNTNSSTVLPSDVFGTHSSQDAPIKSSPSSQFRGLGGRTLNPLASADFSLPNHPYQNWYEPPNGVAHFR